MVERENGCPPNEWQRCRWKKTDPAVKPGPANFGTMFLRVRKRINFVDITGEAPYLDPARIMQPTALMPWLSLLHLPDS